MGEWHLVECLVECRGIFKGDGIHKWRSFFQTLLDSFSLLVACKIRDFPSHLKCYEMYGCSLRNPWSNQCKMKFQTESLEEFLEYVNTWWNSGRDFWKYSWRPFFRYSRSNFHDNPNQICELSGAIPTVVSEGFQRGISKTSPGEKSKWILERVFEINSRRDSREKFWWNF